MKKILLFVLLLMAFPVFLGASNLSPLSAEDNGTYISEVKLIGGSAGEVSALKATAKRLGWTVIESNLIFRSVVSQRGRRSFHRYQG